MVASAIEKGSLGFWEIRFILPQFRSVWDALRNASEEAFEHESAWSRIWEELYKLIWLFWVDNTTIDRQKDNINENQHNFGGITLIANGESNEESHGCPDLITSNTKGVDPCKITPTSIHFDRPEGNTKHKGWRNDLNTVLG